ncbi:LamG-like jellyroll fold domain-containing protein [Hymenobacter edaphi]|uniref:Ig-like domain-containing protein n=1 Tax=Hymenobacter edaphi TaxID=2211146 RepID=UPI001FB47CBF|nr:LamG-like jellyroll fold domain-containing protein [Hymenobacter edaphi]
MQGLFLAKLSTLCTPPTANAGADQQACSGTTVTLGGAPAQPGINYSWSVNPAIPGFSSTQAQPTVPLPSSTTSTQYVFTLTATEAGNATCTATDQVTVGVLAYPNFSVAATAASVCPGQSTTVTASPNTGAAYTYDISPTTGVTALPASGSSYQWRISPTQSTTYTITAHNGPCTETRTLSITVDSPPTANAGADQQACGGSQVTVGGASAQSGLTYTWSVSPAIAGFASSQAQPTVTLPATSASTVYTFTLTVSNGACATSSSARVTALAAPAFTLSLSTPSACSNLSSQLTATPVGGEAYTYTIAIGSGSGTYLGGVGGQSGSNNSRYWGVGASSGNGGATIYTVTASNGTCSLSQTIQHHATFLTPSPTVTSAGRCGAGSVTLMASGAPLGAQYYWYAQSTGGFAAQALGSGPSFTTPALNATTTYYVSYQELSGGANTGCESARVPVTATINAVPAAPPAAATPGSIPLGQSTTLSVTSPLAGLTYTWSGPGLQSTTGSSVTAVPTAQGTAQYSVVASGPGPCSSAPTPVSVTVTAPAPTISTTSPRQGSMGQTVFVSGAGFTGATAVRFGIYDAAYQVLSDTQIRAIVPAIDSRVSGPALCISVVTPAGTGAEVQCFQVTTPTITRITPSSGPAGSVLSLEGFNLAGVTQVIFNGTTTTTSFTFNNNSPTGQALAVTVPAGATTGPITLISAANGTSSPSPTPFTVTAPAPVAYYPFTGNATDASGNGNNGTVSGAVLAADRNCGAQQAYRFDGVNDLINLGTNAQFAMTSSRELTISLWAKPLRVPETLNPRDSANLLFSKYLGYTPAQSNYYASLFKLNGVYKLRLTGQGTDVLDVTLPAGTVDGQWQQFTFVMKAGAGNTKIFRNGTLLASGTVTYHSAASSQPLLLGTYNFSSGNPYTFFRGSLDEVRVFSAALSDSDVAALYTAPAGAAPTLTGISPGSGPVGTTLTLTGTNLAEVTQVGFGGGVTAAVASVAADGSQLTVVVPTGAASGPLSATTPCGTTSTTQSFAVTQPTITHVWTGATSSIWSIAGNWSPAQVPNANSDVVIGSGLARYPVLNGVVQPVRSLQLSNGATLTVQNGGQLLVQGPLTNAGTITHINGLINVQGVLTNAGAFSLGTGPLEVQGDVVNNGTLSAAAGSLLRFASTGTPQRWGGSGTAQLSQLAVGNAAVTLTSPVEVSTSLLLQNGDLASDGHLTLLSTATGTAFVVNSGSGVVTGNATVQRYIDPSRNAGPGYRHFSAPVANTTVADLGTAGYTPVVNPLYNTQGNSATPFPTVFGYDQTRVTSSGNPAPQDFDRGYFSPSALSDALEVGRGYTVNIAAPQTVDFVGTLNHGPISRTGLLRGTQAESGWQLLGNPYPSPLSWDAVGRTNVDAAVYVYRSTGQYAGTYASYVANGTGTNGGTNVIGSGQGFFVRVSTPGSGAISFTNAARLTTTSPVFQRGAATAPLVRLEVSSSGGAADEAVVYFESGGTSGFEASLDAYKLQAGNGPVLASEFGSHLLLSVNALPTLSLADVTVPLYLRAAAGSYSLRASELLRLPTGTYAYLRDTETGALIDLQAQPRYAFTLAPLAPTNRFALLLTQNRVTATTQNAHGQQVGLYPNPAHTQVTLQLPDAMQQQPVTVAVLNALGQQVLTRVLPTARPANALTLPLSGLAKGVYTVCITSSRGPVTKRLIIE